MIAKRLRSAATLSALLGASAASAQTRGPLSLTWDAPADDCPSRDDLMAAVMRLRPHAFQRPAEHPVEAAGRVTRRDGAWSLSLDVRVFGDASTRTVTANTCAEATDAAAVVLALLIEHVERRRPAPVAVVDIAPSTERDARVRFVARLHGAADVGTLPAAAPGVGAAVGFTRSWLRVELGATWFPSQRAWRADGTSSDVGLAAGELRVCALPLRGARLDAGVCAGLAGGVLYAQGIGFDRNRADVTPWWSSLTGVALNVRLVSVASAMALVELGVTLGDPRFVSADGAELHRPARFTGRATVGLELRLP